MKKKILAVVLGLALCLGMTGCIDTTEGRKNYDIHSNLISIEKDLYYYSTTHVVYIVFSEWGTYDGYGYMSPYYSENGKLCTYDTNTKQIVEIEE